MTRATLQTAVRRHKRAMQKPGDELADTAGGGTYPTWCSLRDLLATPAWYYLLSTCLVVVGVAAGVWAMEPCREHPKSRPGGLLDAMGNWDGQWYAEIAADGYTFDPRRESSVAFFPAFPLVGRSLSALTRLRVELALLLAAHLFLFGSLVVMAAYLRERLPPGEHRLIDDILLVAALFPTTFYFRMAYSESMFMFVCLLAFYAIERGWWPTCLALIVGVATAIRPVGIALVAPLGIHLWQQRKNARRFAAQSALVVPLACWGLFAYIAYQWWAFGEPLAFVQTQTHWSRATQHHSWLERVLRSATLEPIRAVYDASSSCYWAHRPPRDAAWLNLMFANPIYFLVTAATLVWGGWRRRLNAKELSFGGLLLLIPYVLQGDRTCMASQARFASVVFPAYLVWGRQVHRLPWPAASAILAASGGLLALYAAMFASWYWFY